MAAAVFADTTPAQFLVPGRVLAIHVAGCGTWNNGDALTLNLYHEDGTVLLSGTSGLAPLSGNVGLFNYDGIIYVHCYKSGTNGECRVSGSVKFYNHESGNLECALGFHNESGIVINTEHPHTWRLTGKFEASGNQIFSNTVLILNNA